MWNHEFNSILFSNLNSDSVGTIYIIRNMGLIPKMHKTIIRQQYS